MTPNEQKQLAESAAEFLEWYYIKDGAYKKRYIHPPNEFKKTLRLVAVNGVVNVRESLSSIFFESEIAPILMHLGKREMEKRGFIIMQINDPSYTCEIAKPEWSGSCVITNENEFIAFWSAVMEAVK